MKSLNHTLRETGEGRPSHIWQADDRTSWITRFVNWIHNWKG